MVVRTVFLSLSLLLGAAPIAALAQTAPMTAASPMSGSMGMGHHKHHKHHRHHKQCRDASGKFVKCGTAGSMMMHPDGMMSPKPQ